MDVLVEAVPLQSIPMSIIQELDRKFLKDRLIKSVLSRALAALPRVTNSSSQYKCDKCGQSFSSFQALGGHKSIHNTNNKRSRDKPTRILVAKSRKRQRTSETETAFKCSLCSKAFSGYQALGGHKASHKRAAYQATRILELFPESASPRKNRLLPECASSCLKDTGKIDLELRL